MKIFVNDEPREIVAGMRVANLIIDMGLEGERGVAVALNDEVVPKQQWSSRALLENDAVLVIRATQGG